MLHQKGMRILTLVCMDLTTTRIFFFIFVFQNHNTSESSFPTIDEDSEYIEETREVEIERTNKAARWVQQNIMQELRTVIGGAQMLPENTMKDFILQVHIPFFLFINWQYNFIFN